VVPRCCHLNLQNSHVQADLQLIRVQFANEERIGIHDASKKAIQMRNLLVALGYGAQLWNELLQLSRHSQRSATDQLQCKDCDRFCKMSCFCGHVDFGVKWQILPLCLKGKFYANHAFVHKGKILRQGCRCVHNDSILRHRIWRKISLWRVMATFTKLTHYIKGKFTPTS